MEKLKVIAVTPRMARQWLDALGPNLRVRDSVVRGLASDMMSGRWVDTDEALAFDHAGVLLDGQTRLAALVAAGMTVRFRVRFNVAREDIDVHSRDRLVTMKTADPNKMMITLHLTDEVRAAIAHRTNLSPAAPDAVVRAVLQALLENDVKKVVADYHAAQKAAPPKG